MWFFERELTFQLMMMIICYSNLYVFLISMKRARTRVIHSSIRPLMNIEHAYIQYMYEAHTKFISIRFEWMAKLTAQRTHEYTQIYFNRNAKRNYCTIRISVRSNFDVLIEEKWLLTYSNEEKKTNEQNWIEIYFICVAMCVCSERFTRREWEHNWYWKLELSTLERIERRMLHTAHSTRSLIHTLAQCTHARVCAVSEEHIRRCMQANNTQCERRHMRQQDQEIGVYQWKFIVLTLKTEAAAQKQREKRASALHELREWCVTHTPCPCGGRLWADSDGQLSLEYETGTCNGCIFQ